jgi:hypothetical protein
MNIAPNTDAAIDFLRRVYPDGPWALTAISTDKKSIETRTFGPKSVDEAQGWVERHNGTRNLYWSVNPPMREINKKAEREDIKAVHYLHVDVDPRAGEDVKEERQRILRLFDHSLPKGVPPPTYVIFSGGGYQGFWKLEEPIKINGELPLAEDAKRYNQQLEILFGADNCHNIDRIMRLPGTINVPDARKLKKGRTAELAELVEWHDDRVYPLGAFSPSHVETASPATLTSVGPLIARRVEPEGLKKWNVPDQLVAVLVQGEDKDRPKEGDNSRSIWVFDVACNLLRCKVPEDVVLGVLTDPTLGISESVLEKGSNALKYATRQIERAKARVALDEMEFVRNEDGKVVAGNQRNVRVALHKMGVTVCHDVFRDRLLIDGLRDAGPTLDDAAMNRLWLTVDEQFGFRPSQDFFLRVVEDTARRAWFHPVRDYLDALVWDGTPRVDRWLVTYGRAEDTELNRAVGALVLVAAVRRVRVPGCKFDEMLVLESTQGTDKSSALAALCAHEDWFSDDLPLNADGKRVIESLAGHWIVEAAELKGMKRGDVEGLKAFLSRRVDRARLAYGRLPSVVPRQCVIVGTTNSSQYLRDATGNRRFWPVPVQRFDTAGLRRDRDQLWAEAAMREAAGESIRLDPKLYGAAAVEQQRRQIEDPFVQVLGPVLADLNGKLRSEDAWTILDVPTGQRTQEHNARLGEAMKELGFERTRLRFDGRMTWCYARGSAEERQLAITIYSENGKLRGYVGNREEAF